MKIHKEGYKIIFIAFVFLILINIGLYLLVFHTFYTCIFIIVISAFLFFSIINFFKNPNRIFIGNTENIVVSPADGKIIAIDEIFESQYF